MKSDFKVKFRGVRGSYPTPSSEFLKYGGNTACVEVNVGGNLIILDAGGGIINLGEELTEENISSNIDPSKRNPVKTHIFLTHLHQDHIQGLPFFKPLYNEYADIKILGLPLNKENLKTTLSQILFDKVFPLGLKDVSCKISITNLTENKAVIINKNKKTVVEDVKSLPKITFDKEDVLITADKNFSHPKNGSLSLKIQYKGKTLVYATDKESYIDGDKKFIEFAYNADVLIHDAQYTSEEYSSLVSSKQGFGHSTYEMAIENAKLSHAKKLVFFHYDPCYNDAFLESLEQKFKKISPQYIFARENMEIDVE